MPYQLEYKRNVDSTWTVDSSTLTAAQFPRTIAGLTQGTLYDTRCKALDGSGNSSAYSATSSATTQSSGGGSLAAFPGAEGYAATTIGGRGGIVVVVSNLNDSGSGSLRAALTMTVPRIVVFNVSGVIALSSSIQLHPNNSYLTVLGQTSPGGITITGGSIANYSGDDSNLPVHDLVFRFLRIRRSDGGDTFGFNWCYNVVLDHCEGSGSNDEVFDFDSSHDFTISWCSYINSSTSGGQGYGMLMAYGPTENITHHHNLSAHHQGRIGAQMHWLGGSSAPDASGPNVDVRNCVYYPNSTGQQIWRADDNPSQGVDLNMVNNYAKVGPTASSTPQLMGGFSGDLFISGNTYVGGDVTNQTSTIGAAHSFPAVTTTTAAQAYIDVLDFAGSFPPDAMQVRTRNDVRDARGVLNRWNDALNTSTTNPPLTTYNGSTFLTGFAATDSNSDGLPDAWASANGNPNPAAIHSSGYAYAEKYGNERAAAITMGQTTLLEQKAALLGANQSILVATTPISTFTDGDINYGASAIYDEIRREIRFIGKKASASFHQVCWSYSLVNGFVMNPFTLHADLLANQLGHGYDLNTVDPDTGDHYFKPSHLGGAVYKWTRSSSTWSIIPAAGGSDALGGIAWCVVGGVGRLVVCDAANFKYYNGSAWVALNGNVAGFGLPGDNYHTLAEYNDTSKVLILGGGNGTGTLRKWDFSLGSPTLTSISSPSFLVGASQDQGPLCSVPDDDKLVAYHKQTNGWAVFDISAGTWSSITQSSGAGTTAQTGTPALGTGGDARTVATPIRLPGRSKITAWMHMNDTQGYRVEVWLYKAS